MRSGRRCACGSSRINWTAHLGGFAAGLIGCALGSLCHGISATSVVGSGQGFGKTVIFRLTVDASTLSAGLLLTLFMGLLGGLLPSLAAMRLRPLESMR